jgi:hypothetical protein
VVVVGIDMAETPVQLSTALSWIVGCVSAARVVMNSSTRGATASRMSWWRRRYHMSVAAEFCV